MLARAFIGWLLSLAITAVLVLAALILLWRYVPPVSTLMLARWATLKPVTRLWTPLEQISPNLVAAVITSEDARFCRHNGIDWNALDDQLNAEDGPSRGASTIAMQTAKNLFLWPHKSVIRKAIEVPLAMAIDFAWPKRRIIEVYLNIAEWGDNGLFGAEAASRHYYGRSARNLSRRQAAVLATALPNPILRRVNRPSRHHQRLARIIDRRARTAGPWLDCLNP
ncbi:MAG: monofunctional biosynthetic peptidoglycan transglycosylase [Hyphomicrobiales bacterium]|nr:monofunctional biosynthetic peptidoglycan transglycosylase [Hyphomicrobiales bacterium]